MLLLKLKMKNIIFFFHKIKKVKPKIYLSLIQYFLDQFLKMDLMIKIYFYFYSLLNLFFVKFKITPAKIELPIKDDPP